MQTTIDQLTKTFIGAAENVLLTKQLMLRSLNGDLQALLLVGSTRRIRLTKELHRALVVVRGRLEQATVLLNEASGGKNLLLLRGQRSRFLTKQPWVQISTLAKISDSVQCSEVRCCLEQ